jgi:ketosteroid isomerase-like protein
MKKWFLVNVKFTRKLNEESTKAVSEFYLIDAISFTDAETQMTQQMEALSKSGECVESFNITSIAKKEYTEVVKDKGNLSFFECKVACIGYDEDSQREKETKQVFIVEEDNIDKATKLMHDKMQEFDTNYTIIGVSKTRIQDVVIND